MNIEAIKRLLPPRHPSGCPQNVLRTMVPTLLQAGWPEAKVATYVAEHLPNLHPNKYCHFQPGD